VFELLKSGILL